LSRLFTSEAAQSGRVEIKQIPGAAPIAPTVEKEPGDDVSLGADGTIVSTSRGETFYWRLANQMKPRVVSVYSLVNGNVQYEWTIANEASAKQRIDSVLVETALPLDISIPRPWVANRVKEHSGIEAFGLSCVLPDDSPNLGIPSGVSLGPIRFSSNLGPGLVGVVFDSIAYVFDTSPTGLTNGQFFDVASPWVREQLVKMDTVDRRRLRRSLIGPVTPLSEDSPQRVLSELKEATVQQADFTVIRKRLDESLPTADAGQLSSWIAESLKQSNAGLETEFLRALQWRLGLLNSARSVRGYDH
jgi:hypothetical protein